LLGGFFARTRTFLELPLEIMAQINPFLLFHVLILFMGVGESPKIAIIVWACLWPVVFSAMHGAASVSPAVIKAGRAFGLGRLGLLTRIVAPSAAPFIFSGLTMALGYSMFMLIAAEMMGASSGLGWLVMAAQMNFQLDRMYAAVLVIAVLGLLMDAILRAAGGAWLKKSLRGKLVGDGS
jgi:NitT/TauT family transport system permease protein